MLSQNSEERVIYRVRKTVLEMLRDRGYGVADAEIEESFEEFEQRYAKNSNINLIAQRPQVSGLPIVADDDANMEEAQNMQESIYVVFETQKTKLN